MKTREELIKAVEDAENALKVFDAHKFNYGDRVIVSDGLGWYQGTYLSLARNKHWVSMPEFNGDDVRTSTYKYCKLDPDIRTLVFKRHDGSSQPDFLIGKLFYYNSTKIGFGSHIGKATNSSIEFWKTVTWYALDPKWMK